MTEQTLCERLSDGTGATVETNKPKNQGMSDLVYEMVRWAVTVARNDQVQRLAQLRHRMALAFPGKDPQINEALKFWASSHQSRHRQSEQASSKG